MWVFGDELVYHGQYLVPFVRNGKYDLKFGVHLKKRGLKVLVDVRIQPFEWPQDGDAFNSICFRA